MKLLVLGVLCCSMMTVAHAQNVPASSIKRLVQPIYPEIARMTKLEGTVKVEVKVAADGKVISAKGSGAHDILNKISEENVRKWTFLPTAKAWGYTITYVYKLEGKETYHPRPTRVILELGRVELIGQPLMPNT